MIHVPFLGYTRRYGSYSGSENDRHKSLEVNQKKQLNNVHFDLYKNCLRYIWKTKKLTVKEKIFIHLKMSEAWGSLIKKSLNDPVTFKKQAMFWIELPNMFFKRLIK